MSELLKYFEGDELAANVWQAKYQYANEETPIDMHRRLAKEFYKIVENWPEDKKEAIKRHPKLKDLSEEKIFNFFDKFKYIVPGGSIMANLGRENYTSLSNCFVLPCPEDNYSSIMMTRLNQAHLMKRRGGVGYDLSKLRPRNTVVHNSAKTSSGAASFMGVNSAVTEEVSQNGRRGALMLSIDLKHPDALEFIESKQDLTKVTGANISVKVDDDFMIALLKGDQYTQSFPSNPDQESEYYKSTKIDPKKLWNRLMQCAWATAEPGIMFWDRMHNYGPDGIYKEYKAVSTNPCGEIPLGGYDSCRLIHINLNSLVKDPFTENAEIDWEKLKEIAYFSVILGDIIVDLEANAVEKILEKVQDDPYETELWKNVLEIGKKGRRVGVGFTGMADLFAKLNIQYGSQQCLNLVHDLMKVIFECNLTATIDMSEIFGPFSGFNGELEATAPNDWYKMVKEEFPDLFDRMTKIGRRNVSFSTVAPTGTVSLMTQSSSGIEPVFSPYYTRRKKCSSPDDPVHFIDQNGVPFSEFNVVHKGLADFIRLKWNKDAAIITKEELEGYYKQSPYFGSTAPEIDWRNRVELQGYVQKYITHSISSTVNLHKDTKVDEIKDLYVEAWKKGLKGITIYRDGCRSGILVNDTTPKPSSEKQEDKFLRRSKTLQANVHKVRVSGEEFKIIIGLIDGNPYEVFAFKNKDLKAEKGTITKISKGVYKFESENKAETIENLVENYNGAEYESVTLYISMLMRHRIPIDQITKVAKKANPTISSFSSAICRILSSYVGKTEVRGGCPECGGKLIKESGCMKCLDCGYSKCE